MWTPDDPLAQRLFCTVCGRALVGDPDDDPTNPTGPMCGDCYREWAMDPGEEDDSDLW